LIDFTINTYENLLLTLINADYQFVTFRDFLKSADEYNKFIVLRHDVDKRCKNSLNTAQIENQLGIQGSYYFRMKPCSFNKTIIQQIESLNHEIGYHYENMDTCIGNLQDSIEDFQNSLDKLRMVANINTICMHGSPLSKWDNRKLWAHYNYRDYGIIGEPYFDIDFNEVHYLTDTGRRWDGDKVAVRDKVISGKSKIKIRSTNEFIQAIYYGNLSNKIMITVHPQRWSNNLFFWGKEIILQNIKNTIKYFIVKHNH